MRILNARREGSKRRGGEGKRGGRFFLGDYF